MGSSSLVSRDNTTGAYTVRETHTFTSSFSTNLIINTSPNGYGRGTQIASGSGSSLSGSRNMTGTSYAAVTVTDSWYFWVYGQVWNLTSNTSFSYTVPAAVFSITFDHNDGTGTTETVNRTYNTAWNAPTPTKTGYAFTGWYTDPTGGTQVDVTGSVPGKVAEGTADEAYTNGLTLYAHWEAMSILHVKDGSTIRTITNIKVVQNGTVRDIIGCYAVVDGNVYQGV